MAHCGAISFPNSQQRSKADIFHPIRGDIWLGIIGKWRREGVTLTFISANIYLILWLLYFSVGTTRKNLCPGSWPITSCLLNQSLEEHFPHSVQNSSYSEAYGGFWYRETWPGFMDDSSRCLFYGGTEGATGLWRGLLYCLEKLTGRSWFRWMARIYLHIERRGGKKALSRVLWTSLHYCSSVHIEILLLDGSP